jgi:hypothetical protein
MIQEIIDEEGEEKWEAIDTFQQRSILLQRLYKKNFEGVMSCRTECPFIKALLPALRARANVIIEAVRD